MTNYIEQLMKKAGVDSEVVSEQILTDYGVESVGVKQVYPAFTPEKQLELIKLIGKELVSLNYRQHKDFYAMQVDSVNRYCGIYKEADTFEELLADIIVELIKLGELDKSEVKRILEG